MHFGFLTYVSRKLGFLQTVYQDFRSIHTVTVQIFAFTAVLLGCNVELTSSSSSLAQHDDDDDGCGGGR